MLLWEPQTALGSAQTPVYRVTGSENEPKPALLMVASSSAPSAEQGRKPALPVSPARWSSVDLSGDSPSQPQSQNENRYHSLWPVAPGKHDCHLFPEQDVLGTVLGLTSLGFMKI